MIRKMIRQALVDKDMELEILFGATEAEMAKKSNEKLRERNKELQEKVHDLEHRIKNGLLIEPADLEKYSSDEDWVFIRISEGRRYKVTVEGPFENELVGLGDV